MVLTKQSHGENHDSPSKSNGNLTAICIEVECIYNTGDVPHQRVREGHLPRQSELDKWDGYGVCDLTFEPESLRAKLTLLMSPFAEATMNADSPVGYHLRFRIPPPLVRSVKVCFNLLVREILE